MDQASEEFLRYLLDSVPATRVLLILTFRPEYAYPLGQRSYQTWLNLTPLSSEDSARMAEAVMAGQSAPNELRELISRKAEGNPFFVEEVLKSLQEIGALRRDGARNVLDRPIHEIVVPDTIQDVLMARIDRLGEEPKRALQLAAVIGREFARRLIDRWPRSGAHRWRDERAESPGADHRNEPVPRAGLHVRMRLPRGHLQLAWSSGARICTRLIGLAIEDLYADRSAENYEVLGITLLARRVGSTDYLLKAAQKAATPRQPGGRSARSGGEKPSTR
jgi:hypothetical protein